MKLLSFINPRSGKKTWGDVEGNQVYDFGKRLSAYFPDLKSAIAGNALNELTHMRGRFRKRKKSYAKRASMLEPSDTA